MLIRPMPIILNRKIQLKKLCKVIKKPAPIVTSRGIGSIRPAVPVTL